MFISAKRYYKLVNSLNYCHERVDDLEMFLRNGSKDKHYIKIYRNHVVIYIKDENEIAYDKIRVDLDMYDYLSHRDWEYCSKVLDSEIPLTEYSIEHIRNTDYEERHYACEFTFEDEDGLHCTYRLSIQGIRILEGEKMNYHIYCDCIDKE